MNSRHHHKICFTYSLLRYWSYRIIVYYRSFISSVKGEPSELFEDRVAYFTSTWDKDIDCLRGHRIPTFRNDFPTYSQICHCIFASRSMSDSKTCVETTTIVRMADLTCHIDGYGRSLACREYILGSAVLIYQEQEHCSERTIKPWENPFFLVINFSFKPILLCDLYEKQTHCSNRTSLSSHNPLITNRSPMIPSYSSALSWKNNSSGSSFSKAGSCFPKSGSSESVSNFSRHSTKTKELANVK